MAKVKQQDLDRALLESACGDSYMTCKVLLDLGANPNAISPVYRQNTPLHEAAEKGRIDICHLLMQRGAKINARNGRGYTPLYMAVINKHKDLALILVSLGADTICYAHPDKDSPNNSWPFVCDRLEFKGMTLHSAAIRLDDLKRMNELLVDPRERCDSQFLEELAKEAKKLKKPDMAAFIQAHRAKTQMNAIRETAPKGP